MTAGRPRTKTTDTHRICKSCSKTKELSEFYSFRVYDCKECSRIRSKAYYESTKKEVFKDNDVPRNERIAARTRLKKYGVTQEEFLNFIKLAADKCPGCQRKSSQFSGRWCLDHCHTTGNVRGVLCGKCNSALGFADDSVETLQRLISYLKVAS